MEWVFKITQTKMKIILDSLNWLKFKEWVHVFMKMIQYIQGNGKMELLKDWE